MCRRVGQNDNRAMSPCSEVTKLCLPLLDMASFTALSVSCKQLRSDVQEIMRDDYSLLRSLFKKEMKLACRDSFTYLIYAKHPPVDQRAIGRLKEFLGLCCSLYGLIALPSVLELQALLLHTTDPYLCKLLVSAGARITDSFVTTAALGSSWPRISFWIEAFNALGVPTGLSPIMEAAGCNGPKVPLQEVTQLQPEDLFKLAALYTTQGFVKGKPTPPDMWPPTGHGFDAAFLWLPQAMFWSPALEVSQLLQLACIRYDMHVSKQAMLWMAHVGRFYHDDIRGPRHRYQ